MFLQAQLFQTRCAQSGARILQAQVLGAIHRDAVLAATYEAWLADIPMSWL